jgi:hypothetical protein
MVGIGIGITAATVAILVLGFFRARRRRPFPAEGWLGIIALAGAEWLMFRGVEPVATYFTPIAWSAYILIADSAVLALTGRSRLHDAPLTVARMALLSIPLWLIFEAYNLRLQNWTYVGVPPLPQGLLGYGWSFATITPAIFETSDLRIYLRSCGLASSYFSTPSIAASVCRRFLEIFRKDFGGGCTDSFFPAGYAGGCGNFGTGGRPRSGTTSSRSFSRRKSSRCPRRDFSASCRLRWNVL